MWLRVCSLAMCGLPMLLAQVAVAGSFGFGPCCPPSTCGIVPCDRRCAGPSIRQMGILVSGAADGLSAVYETLGKDLLDVVQSMSNLGIDITDAYTTRNNDLLKGLEASTARIEMAYAQTEKNLEGYTDHTVTSLVNALTEQSVVRGIEDNRLTIGETTEPVSGDTGANLALTFQTLEAQMAQVLGPSVEGFLHYMKDGNDTVAAAGTGQHRVRSLAALENFDRLDYLLTHTVLDDAHYQSMQDLIGLTVSPTPMREGDLPLETDYELNRRRHAVMLAIAYGALMMPALSRKGIDNGDWVAYYQDLLRNGSGRAGLTAVYRADIQGRLTDPEWWASVRRLSTTGLQREITYQRAIALHLQDRMDILSQSADQVLAVTLAKRLETEARQARRIHEQP